MFRKMIPLAVAVVLLIGCKKKPEEAGGGDGKTDSDPAATYTIKIRDAQTGDKSEVIATMSGNMDVNFAGKSKSTKEEARYEYTEYILDHPAGAVRATKLSRMYKTAQNYDEGTNALKARSFEGRTVTVEKKGVNIEVTADGEKLNSADADEFVREFRMTDKRDINELLPKTAVIGDSWPLELAAVKSGLGGSGIPVDAAKSKMTGKLARAYT